MIGYINDLIYVGAPAPLQNGVANGIKELPSTFYQDLVQEYSKKRDKICSALRQAGLPPFVPEGAYYVLADVSRLPGASSKERAMRLLSKTGVASVPGAAFYHSSDGESLVRFCFAKTDEELDQACQSLARLS